MQPDSWQPTPVEVDARREKNEPLVAWWRGHVAQPWSPARLWTERGEVYGDFYGTRVLARSMGGMWGGWAFTPDEIGYIQGALDVERDRNAKAEREFEEADAEAGRRLGEVRRERDGLLVAIKLKIRECDEEAARRGLSDTGFPRLWFSALSRVAGLDLREIRHSTPGPVPGGSIPPTATRDASPALAEAQEQLAASRMEINESRSDRDAMVATALRIARGLRDLATKRDDPGGNDLDFAAGWIEQDFAPRARAQVAEAMSALREWIVTLDVMHAENGILTAKGEAHARAHQRLAEVARAWLTATQSTT